IFLYKFKAFLPSDLLHSLQKSMLLNPIEKKSSRGVSDKGNNVGILTPAITGGTAYGKTQ
ncbi:MAG: hypothetical protein SOV22_13125, partial [Blautia obeum]|nr:hypothetical protein [Blautia obeum]